ncbi:hypothetical protein BpHYR1_048330 [Brachionus plicatilis]|uniref:Uncharacterized protein n=1 Tax=Brachionus plicatilis TaxID=10195 RepID=A0A3M7PDT8_BRAPC|nr:hypothetical protein BpHYR1_048330 [Brachionus plicatilis]
MNLKLKIANMKVIRFSLKIQSNVLKLTPLSVNKKPISGSHYNKQFSPARESATLKGTDGVRLVIDRYYL